MKRTRIRICFISRSRITSDLKIRSPHSDLRSNIGSYDPCITGHGVLARRGSRNKSFTGPLGQMYKSSNPHISSRTQWYTDHMIRSRWPDLKIRCDPWSDWQCRSGSEFRIRLNYILWSGSGIRIRVRFISGSGSGSGIRGSSLFRSGSDIFRIRAQFHKKLFLIS